MRLPRPMSLRTGIALFVSTVVLLSLTFTGVLIGIREIENTKKNESNKAMTLAEAVADSPLVKEALEGVRNPADVQAYASAVQEAAGVRFVVVMDMNHIRLSHPNPAMIGKHFVGGDEGPAMHGKHYVSVAQGTLGTSLRAFAPVYADNGVQVGVVSVGILVSQVNDAVLSSLHFVYWGIGIGLVIGIIGALFVAARIKRVLFGLEPYQIGRLWQERNALLESVREGVLAVDIHMTIIVANAEAVRMFRNAGLETEVQGKPPGDYMPEVWFQEVLQTGRAKTDMEHDLNGLTLVVNVVPVSLEGNTIGVVASFRDKTELKQLAEQLTGVKLYAEALRSQSHEFMNRMHVVLALTHAKEYERLTTYIRQISDKYHEEVGSIASLVREPVIAGFLLSKLSFARERNVTLHMSGQGTVPETNRPDCIDDIITIIGNLMDNAFEAVEGQDNPAIDMTLSYENGWFQFSISDNGTGIPQECEESIFQKGFSTKGTGHGFGLFFVRQSVQKLGGTLLLQPSGSNPCDAWLTKTSPVLQNAVRHLGGATFIVILPYGTEEAYDDSGADCG